MVFVFGSAEVFGKQSPQSYLTCMSCLYVGVSSLVSCAPTAAPTANGSLSLGGGSEEVAVWDVDPASCELWSWIPPRAPGSCRGERAPMSNSRGLQNGSLITHMTPSSQRALWHACWK
jgi:hypothetical protein